MGFLPIRTPLYFGTLATFASSCADQLALELRQPGEHRQHQPPVRRSRVKPVSKTDVRARGQLHVPPAGGSAFSLSPHQPPAPFTETKTVQFDRVKRRFLRTPRTSLTHFSSVAGLTPRKLGGGRNHAPFFIDATPWISSPASGWLPQCSHRSSDLLRSDANVSQRDRTNSSS